MNTSTLIPSQNEGLLPVLFGSNDTKKEEPTYTPYEVVNDPVRKDKRRKHFIEANTEPIDMIRLKSDCIVPSKNFFTKERNSYDSGHCSS